MNNDVHDKPLRRALRRRRQIYLMKAVNKLCTQERKTLYSYIEVFTGLYEHFNIKLFAIGGTLLGAIRNQDLIEWDDDIDYGILYRDINKLNHIDVLRYLNDRGFALFNKPNAVKYDKILHLIKLSTPHKQDAILNITDTDRHKMIHLKHEWIRPQNGIIADIFGYKFNQGHYYLKRHGEFVQPICRPCLKDRLVKYKMGNTHAYSFRYPDKYLKSTYGANWRRPKIYKAHRPQDKRVESKHTTYIIGVFDVLHVGHYNLFTKSKKLNTKLVIGVCSDRLVQSTKGNICLYNELQRCDMISKLQIIDKSLIYDDLDQSSILMRENVDSFVVPPDYGTYEEHVSCLSLCHRLGIEVVKFDRTEGISSTQLREIIGHG